MSFIVTGSVVLGGAVIGATGSIIAGQEQASGAKAAANTQAQMFNTIQANEQPFIQSGQGAEGELNYLLGIPGGTGPGGAPNTPVAGLPSGYLTQTFNPTQAQLNAYPGYQFQQQAGQLATESAATPGVGALSGASLKSLMDYNQGLAASNYNSYFNQFQTQQSNIFNRLTGIAGIGQNAAGQLGNNGAQLGTGIAQAQAAGAAATAGGIVGATNNIGNGLNTYAMLNYLNNNPNTPPPAQTISSAGDSITGGE